MVHITFYTQPRRNRPFLRISKLKQGIIDEVTDPETQAHLVFTDIGASSWKIIKQLDDKASIQPVSVKKPKRNWALVIRSAYFNVTLNLMEYSKSSSSEGEGGSAEGKLVSVECDGDYFYIVHFIQQFHHSFTEKKPDELSNWAAFTKITAISPPDHLSHWEEYLKVNLGDEARQRLQYMESKVSEARNRGVNTSEADQMIMDMDKAIEKKDYPQSLDIARMIETVLEGATTEHKEMSELSTDANDAILFTQQLLMDAKKEGVDVSEAENQFHQVKLALDDKDFQKVVDMANKTKNLVEKLRLKHTNAIEHYNLTKEKLKKASKKGVDITEPNRRLKEAKQAFEDGEYDVLMETCDQALDLLEEEKEKAKEDMTKKEKAREALESAKDAMETAKEQKLNIQRQERLFNEAEKQMDTGNEDMAVENAELIIEQIEELKSQSTSLEEEILEITNQVDEFKAFMDMSKSLKLLEQTSKAFEDNDFENVSELLNQVKDQIERTKTVSRPRISIGFSNKQFQSGVWNRCKLTITNSGKAHAKNVELVFSGTIEVMRIRRLPVLKAGERKTVEIGLRSNDVGELPLDMEITYYRHYDDAKYQAQGVKWVKFGKKPVISGEEEEIPKISAGEEDEAPTPPTESPPPDPEDGDDYIVKLVDRIQESYTYLVKGESFEPAFQAFERMIKTGSTGMCITRNFPKRIQDKYDLGETKVIWLTNVQGDEMIRPSDIEKIRHSISVFLQEEEGRVLFLDGIEYLITHNKYESVLKFVQSLKDLVAIRKAKFLIPISPSAIEGHELKLLEREVDDIIQLET